jgi:MFS family permease
MEADHPTLGTWRTPDLWRISFSAFFADLGYQAVLALFPLYLVLHLGAPVWVFGVSQALAYGPGALFGYWGGRWGDRYGRRKVALLGNAFLPLLALIGLAGTPWLAVLLLAAGWWARNFRSPPRRALVTESVEASHQGEAFGFLHALDVGGGMLAAVYAFLLLEGGAPYSGILLGTGIPLILSTLILSRVRVGRSPRPSSSPPPPVASPEGDQATASGRWLVGAVLAATLLYGFASYSLGFPVLTTAQSTHTPAFGVLVFIAFLGVSALVGLGIGRVRLRRARGLALGGYGVAAVGSGALAVAASGFGGLAIFLVGAGLLGAALGVIETFEPTLLARVVPASRRSREFGRLTAFRSVGLFAANLILGVLFAVNPAYPYLYALGAAGAAALLMLGLLPRIGTAGDVDAVARR